MPSKIDELFSSDLALSTNESVIRGAVETVRDEVRRTAKKGEKVMVVQSAAAVAAIDGEFYTRSDLASEWAPKKGEKISLDTVRLYYRLGLAQKNLDVRDGGVMFDDSGKTVWDRLAGRGGATISAVGNYIEFGDPIGVNDKGALKYAKKDEVHSEPTQEGLITLLRLYFKPDGSPYSPKERKAHEAKRLFELFQYEAPKDESEGGEGGEGADAPVPATRSIEARFKDAVVNLMAICDLISDESVWESVKGDAQQAYAAIDKVEEQFTPKAPKGRGGRKAS